MTRRFPLWIALTVSLAAGLGWLVFSRRGEEPPIGDWSGEPPAGSAPAHGLLLVTIDGLRADRAGEPARNAPAPAFADIAAGGARFANAYAASPLTLPSHATLLTGLYPPQHGARADGLRVKEGTATLATRLRDRGLVAGAFVSTARLAGRFGLEAGFDAYDAPAAGTRPAAETVDAAIAWLGGRTGKPTFLWVQLAAPAGTGLPRPPARAGADVRGYDRAVRDIDRQLARLLDALGPARATTFVALAGSYAHALGEHDEFGNGLFVYDTTLHVPLAIAGPGVPAGRAIDAPVGLVDLAPTLLALLGAPTPETDGLDLSPSLTGDAGIPDRALYAESYAPLVSFDWTPLRSVRSGTWKFIEAPEPELYDLSSDARERVNVAKRSPQQVNRMREQLPRFGSGSLTLGYGLHADAAARAGLEDSELPPPPPGDEAPRPDPKDRREAWARLHFIRSGAVPQRQALAYLRRLLREDDRNGEAHRLLGEALARGDNCADAEPHLRAAIGARLPEVEPYLALSTCLASTGDGRAARSVLSAARRMDPGHPVVEWRVGQLAFEEGRLEEAVEALGSAVRTDPGLHEARLLLARALARSGRLGAARDQVDALLKQLPADAAERADAERLRDTLR